MPGCLGLDCATPTSTLFPSFWLYWRMSNHGPTVRGVSSKDPGQKVQGKKRDTPISVPVHTLCIGLGHKDFNKRATNPKCFQVVVCSCRILTTNRPFLHFLVGSFWLDRVTPGAGVTPAFFWPQTPSLGCRIFLFWTEKYSSVSHWHYG